VFAVGQLPVPQHPLIFEELRLAQLVDIPPPPPAPRQAPANSAPTSPDLAPIVEPQAITAEPDRPERATPTPGAVDGVSDASGLDVLSVCKGCVTNPPPPPAPPPPPPKPERLHAGMQAPVKIVNVDPVYPSIAQTARIKGVVILEAVIDERGSVKSVSVLRSIQLLDQAAVDAVRQWRFTPARLNGAPVPVVMTVTVNFQLDR
jgi:periplasmic protein TonB